MLTSRTCTAMRRPFTAAPSRACAARGRRPLMVHSMMGGMSPEALQKAMQDPKMREALQEAMKNPAVMQQIKQMQEAMQNPEVQQQMAAMRSYMQNQQLQERMKELKDDPEFAEIFADIQKNGMQALMKYYNDPKFLSKLGSKLGDVVPPAGAAGVMPAAAAGMAAPAAPEINDMIDASKYGDLEAVEDFIAIGKDVNMKDAESRTPLHFACGFAHDEIARLLIESGANVEATDSKGNTPLHYAAGYGRPALTRLMLDAGANKAAKNGNGKTALELVLAAPANPINKDAEVMAKLKA